MTSRLDRLLSLLESSPNNFLRSTAAQQLGELVRTYHGDLNDILSKLDTLINHKNWVCRITASEVTSSIVKNLPVWTPDTKFQESDIKDPLSDLQNGFLSFNGLDLQTVLAQGAHLYSIDEREIAVKENIKFDRQSLNKFMGIDDTGGSIVLKALQNHSSVNVDSIVSEEDLNQLNSQFIFKNDVKASIEAAYGKSCVRQIRRKRVFSQDESKNSDLKAYSYEETGVNKWPLDTFCTRLLVDLWAVRWETRHGAASCLRELLSCTNQMESAGMADYLSEEQNSHLHSMYLEDIAVRVLCTLALDKFSDFVSDEVVAPVRETAAQLLGILSRYLTQAQTLQLMNHLLDLAKLDYSNIVGNNGTNWMIVHGALIGLKYLLVSRKDLWITLLWPIATDLLCRLGGVQSWPPPDTALDETSEIVALRLFQTVYHNPGAEDILAATVDALLPIANVVMSKLETDHPKIKLWLVNCIWALLAKCSDLSAAISPLLRLITELCTSDPRLIVVGQKQIDNSEIIQNISYSRISLIIRLIHHISATIRNLAVKALHTLFSLLYNESEILPLVSIPLLHSTLDQLFQRILLESDSTVIKSCVRLWTMLIQRSFIDSLVHAALGRLDLWLCQCMQPSRTPFTPTMLNFMQPTVTHTSFASSNGVIPDLQSCEFTQMYIAGPESLDWGEREREHAVMETRITAIGLLAELSARMSQSTQLIPVSVPNKQQPSMDLQSNTPDQFETVQLYPGAYILQRLITSIHLSDRQANQRFLAGLFVSRFAHGNAHPADRNIQWFEVMEYLAEHPNSIQTSASALVPSPSSVPSPIVNIFNTISSEQYVLFVSLGPNFQEMREKLQTCLTEVIYYEEILPSFVAMQDSARNFISLIAGSKLVLDQEFSHINSSSVLNIVECQRLLGSCERELKNIVLTTPNDNQLFDAFQRAKLALDNCLMVQLHLASRVELAMAAALIRCKYLIPGKMTLLIRPLMDTIRGSQPTPPSMSKNGTSEADPHPIYPCTGMTDRLQRLAAYCLMRLLWCEWSTESRSILTSNNSKAAQKVIRNLVNYLITSDSLLLNSQEEESMLCSEIQNSSNGSLSNGECVQRSTTISTAGSGIKRISISSKFGVNLETDLNSRGILTCGQAIRYRGTCYSFVYLYRFFTEFGLSPYRLLLGLPTLWNVMWTEWLMAIALHSPETNIALRSSLEHSSGPGGISNVELLSQVAQFLYDGHPYVHNKPLSPPDTHNFQPFLNGLCTNALCIPTLLLANGDDGQKHLTALCLLRAALLSALIQPVDDQVAHDALKVRLAAARLILTLLEYAETAAMMNELIDWTMRYIASCVDSYRLTVLIILNYIIKNLLDNQYKRSIAKIHAGCQCTWARYPEWDSDNPRLPGCPRDTDHLDNLRLILPFTVILLTPVMRSLSDHIPKIREYACQVFANLLVLMPLEPSLPNPEGMHTDLQLRRLEDRKFIDCLLNPRMIENYSLPVILNVKLRPYQQDGVNWLTFLNRFGLHGILCDDLGLGKTLQSIYVLAADHKNKSSEESVVSLVVCPVTLTGHWLNEIVKFTQDTPNSLRAKIYNSNLFNQKAKAWDTNQNIPLENFLTDCDVIIASYENIRSNSEFFSLIQWNYVILDEGHVIKNSRTKLSMKLHSLKARHRLILTGTPVQNYVGELWSLFKFLMPGFLGSETLFNQRFTQPLQQMRDAKCTKADLIKGEQALDRLHKIVLPFMLRRLKENVLKDLPPKIIQDYPCQLTKLQRKLYDDYLKQEKVLHKEVKEDEDGTPEIDSHRRYGFEQMQYLLAICNHPALVLLRQRSLGAKQQKNVQHPMLKWVQEQIQKGVFGSPGTNIESVCFSGKLMAFRQLLIDCGFQASAKSDSEVADFSSNSSDIPLTMASNSEPFPSNNCAGHDLFSQHRLLVFSRTTRMLELTESLLNSHFPNLTYLRLDGSVPTNQRFGICQRFNADPSIDALLLTTSVGGVGLNLTGADTVVFLENDWNPSKDLQAMDRAHRIGQRRTVSVYRLVTSDTIEDQVMNLQRFKQGLTNALINTDNESYGSALGASGASLMENMIENRVSGSNDIIAPVNLEDERLSQYEEEYNLDSFIAKLGIPQSKYP